MNRPPRKPRSSRAWVSRCDKCRKEIDTLGASNMSVGMSGVVCEDCGKKMQRGQQAQIERFTKEAEAKGLIVSVEMDAMGRAELIAKPPPKDSKRPDEADVIDVEAKEEEHGETERVDGHSGVPTERVPGLDED